MDDLYECERCGIVIPEDEYDWYGGSCEECYQEEWDEFDDWYFD